MKRISGIKDKIVEFGNIYTAYKKAAKNKRNRKEVKKYTRELEENLIQLQKDIIEDTYVQGVHREFKVYDPKVRLIKALPFNDRVLQHAINNIIEPIFDKTFYYYSYACRKGKGSHAASNVLKSWLFTANKYGIKLYCLKCDVRKYFDSIDRDILLHLLFRKLKCEDMIIIFKEIIQVDSGKKGIPIGNLLSQLFANIYLNELDTFIKQKLGIKYYIRYMDDFVILSTNKHMLKEYLDLIIEFLDTNLKLSLNNKTRIFPVSSGVEFVGYVHYYDYIKIRKSSYKRGKRKINIAEKELFAGKITPEQYRSKIHSVIGHIKHTDNYKLVSTYEQRYEETIKQYNLLKFEEANENEWYTKVS